MGKLLSGEIGIVAAHGRLVVIYGTEDSVDATRCLLHNHPQSNPFPSQADACASLRERLTGEFISYERGIAQVRYHFRQRNDIVTIDELTSDQRREEKVPKTDEEYRGREYIGPVKIWGLPIDEHVDDPKERVVHGTYDITIIDWYTFLQKYSRSQFWRMFRRKSNWAKIFSRNGIYTLSQNPLLHPSPQQQT